MDWEPWGPARAYEEHQLVELRGEEELAVHWPAGRRIAELGDLKPLDHCTPIYSRCGGLVEQRAASNPDLYPG